MAIPSGPCRHRMDEFDSASDPSRGYLSTNAANPATGLNALIGNGTPSFYPVKEVEFASLGQSLGQHMV